MIAIERNEYTPACRKAETIVLPDSSMMIGVPVTLGAICITASVKRLSTALSLASPDGKTWTR